MKKSLIISLLSLGLLAVGCSSNNKAATPENSSSSSSSAQPAGSSDNSSNANSSSSNTSSSASTSNDANSDQHFITDAAKGNRKEVQLGQMMVSKASRSEEHTSELQSRQYLVCRL